MGKKALYILILCFFSQTFLAEDCQKTLIPNDHSKLFKLFRTQKSYFIEFKTYSLSLDPSCKADIYLSKAPNRLALTSTTILPWVTLLGHAEKVRAFSGVKYISDTKRYGSLVELGFPMKEELLLKNKIDLVITYQMNNVVIDQSKKPRVYFDEFKELTPLARLEWIKVLAVLNNDYKKGATLFNEIKSKYESIVSTKPLKGKKVVVTAPYGGQWQMTGKESDFAHMITALGAQVLTTNNNRAPTQESFEKVVRLFSKADIWIPNNFWRSKQDIFKSDGRIAKFLPKRIIILNNTKRIKSGQKNDYWEDGVARPDKIVKDLSMIFSNPKNMTWFEVLE